MSRDYQRNSRSQSGMGRRLLSRYLPRSLKLLGTLRDVALIDVACGPGILTLEAARILGCKTEGMDIDPAILSAARQNAPGLEFHAGDFRSPPPALRGRFDVVFSNEGLHWTRTPPASFRKEAVFYRFLPRARQREFDAWGLGQVRLAFRGLRSLLRPNGVLVVQMGAHGQMQAVHEAINETVLLPDFAALRRRLWNPVYYPRRADAARELRAAGFERVAIETWQEPFIERTLAQVVGLVRATMTRALSDFLPAPTVALFFRRLEDSLARSRARPKWSRMVIVARRRAITARG